MGGFGLDLGGLLKTSFLAGRWLSMAIDFLGAGVGGARIFLHLVHFTLTKTHIHWRSAALTKLSAHSLFTHSDQFTVGVGGGGVW